MGHTKSFEKYLEVLWPEIDMGPNPNLQQNQINTVNVDIITLNPNLRKKPKLNLMELQKEFNALSQKIEPFKFEHDDDRNKNKKEKEKEIKIKKSNHIEYER